MGWKVLVVDDINDTGATIACIREQIENPHHLKIAVLTDNVTSNSQVDYWGAKINKQTDPSWMVYPWEKDPQT
jgi:hypoxanthine phosphoribosyltransferase